jgi:hypothetical protein
MGPSHGPQAVQQLRSVLPTVLGNADTDLQARVQLVLAQALLADATTAHLKADPEESGPCSQSVSAADLSRRYIYLLLPICTHGNT